MVGRRQVEKGRKPLPTGALRPGRRAGATLRYGENPHQQAALYRWAGAAPAFEQLQGKELSYNNIVDLEAAWAMPQEFAEPTVAIIKHTNPSGLASAANRWSRPIGWRSRATRCRHTARSSRQPGSRSALVEEIGRLFVEVLAAPAYTPDALAWLAEHKKNCRVMSWRTGRRDDRIATALVLRSVGGGLLAQTPDDRGVDESSVAGGHPAPAHRGGAAQRWPLPGWPPSTSSPTPSSWPRARPRWASARGR